MQSLDNRTDPSIDYQNATTFGMVPVSTTVLEGPMGGVNTSRGAAKMTSLASNKMSTVDDDNDLTPNINQRPTTAFESSSQERNVASETSPESFAATTTDYNPTRFWTRKPKHVVTAPSYDQTRSATEDVKSVDKMKANAKNLALKRFLENKKNNETESLTEFWASVIEELKLSTED